MEIDGELMPPGVGSRVGCSKARWGCTQTALGWATAVDKLRQAALWPGVLRERMGTALSHNLAFEIVLQLIQSDL
jgi:hypothetical protein